MRVPLVLAAFLPAAVGCTPPLEPPPPDLIGALRITVSTTGGDADLDGYAITVDGTARDSIGANQVTVIPELPAGPHDVGLVGVAENCAVAQGSHRSITVTEGDTAQVKYPVACRATGVRVSAATAGLDRDSDGYLISIDGGDGRVLGPAGSVTLTRMGEGIHTVALGGLAANCDVSGENPRDVTVSVGQVLSIQFTVTCVTTTGVIAITAATSGIDLPDTNVGYTVRVDEAPPWVLPANGTATLDSLPPGEYRVTLGAVPANCIVASGNARTVSVTVGTATRDTARITFSASCVAVTGALEVAAVTSGADYDLDGYAVSVDGDPWGTVGANGVWTTLRLPGDHTVALDRVASNCQVVGENPRTLTVTAGGSTRDTTRTTFTITCARTTRIAFTNGGWLVVANGDGSSQTTITDGNDPTWSPDGTRLAFHRPGYCDYYYYYPCYDGGIFAINQDGTGEARLTTESQDRDAAWRPDGTRIAFARYAGGQYALHLVNPSGSGLTRLTPTTGIISADAPSWSPDGSRLAFTCQVVSGNLDLCVINADGTGLSRVTTDTARDARPTWSPDGTRIAFTTTAFSGTHELALIAPDGSGLTRVSPGTGVLQPAWSPDGARIAFTAFRCDPYSGCMTPGLFSIRPDGTERTQLTMGADYGAAWRP